MKFKELGYYLSQIGLYFSIKENVEFEDCQLHNNITNYLLQVYLYLVNYNTDTDQRTPLVENVSVSANTFLSKKQVIEIYSALFTEYGLTQAIHKGDIPYHKRGSKYFFKKEEIDLWLNNTDNHKNKASRISNKFV